ncbi:MAG TPA: hypothetical protein VN108_10560 [Marmoricola sp.]|nr:hypothetical protein [Marmoricola sp.]
MTKVMFAVHGESSAVRLMKAEFRDALRDAGASAIQINVDDEAVGPAMRFGPGAVIRAVVSVWAEDVERVVAAVVEACGDQDAHAYRVTERVRLDPAPVPDGTRSDVMAQVAILRKPESMSWDDYLSYWMLEHTAIAIRTQNTSAYVQNIVEEGLTPTSPVISAIVEEHFPMVAMHDSHEFYGSGGDEAELSRRMAELMDSVAKFGADQGLDLVPTSRYFWSL